MTDYIRQVSLILFLCSSYVGLHIVILCLSCQVVKKDPELMYFLLSVSQPRPSFWELSWETVAIGDSASKVSVSLGAELS